MGQSFQDLNTCDSWKIVSVIFPLIIFSLRSLTLEDIILIPDELESRLFGDKGETLLLV